MKLNRLGLALWLGVALAAPLAAEQVATVTGNRVNVRGQANLQSEVVTQLNEGDTVTILEEVVNKTPAAGEPARWARIKLPATTSAFVFAPYIDSQTKAVKVSRLNVRGGPGENFSVLGRLQRGAVVKEVQTTASWMEIEAPSTAYAFVAMSFLEPAAGSSAAAAVPPVTAPSGVSDPTTRQTGQSGTGTAATSPIMTAPEEESAPAEVEPTVTELADEEPVVTEPPVRPTTAPAAGSDEWPTAGGAPSVVAVSPTVPTAETSPVIEEAPRRVVIREGRVVVAFSPQAPTRYGLMSLETRRLINYLHSEQEGLNLKAFSGRDVFVTGEELLDARWETPVIDVEDVRLAPAP